MSEVELRTVTAGEAELRLDRWFRRHFPALPHGRLQKLLRTGQVRIDGRRAQADARLAAGQTIRVPPLGAAPAPTLAQPAADPRDAAFLRRLILVEDDALLVLNKPEGLAVQGGTGTRRHIDGMLAALASNGERPRLVHRLDRDTSGILVVAKTAAAAATLTRAFRQHKVDKLYWALVVGRPALAAGIIDQPLAKQGGAGRERVAPDEEGRMARTAYRIVARAGKVASWLAMKPLTGRTHQLRAHCVVLGTPILGDPKYGHPAGLSGAPQGLMLHAREIRLPHPDGGVLAVTAPLSQTLRAGFAWLGFEPDPSLPGATLADFEQA
jgi:23S rRNA pseudouridine955/2504/2580 synthase